MWRSTNEQFKRSGHCPNIRGDIDRVGDQEQGNNASKKPRGVMFSDIGSETMAGYPSNARTNHLDTNHQGERKECGPQHRIAKACSYLRVGGNAAGVIVGSARDESRTQFFPERSI